MPKSFIIIFLYILASFSLLAEVIDVSNKTDTAPQALLQLNVVDVQETWLDDRKTLSVSFSQKLDKNIPYDSFVTVTEDGISLKGNWVQSKNPTCLYLTNIKPEKKYEIFIRPGIKSENGLKLLTPKHFNVTTEALSSEVLLLEDKQNLSPHNFSALHIRSSDIKKQNVSLYRLSDTKHKQFIQKLQTVASLSNWNIDDIIAVSDLITQKNISIDNVENERVLSTVELERDVKTGLYFVTIEALTAGGEVIKQLKYFSVSDLDLVTIDEPASEANLLSISKKTGTLFPNATLQLITPERVIERNSNKEGRVPLTKKELSQVNWIRLSGKQGTVEDKQTDLGYLFQRNSPPSQNDGEARSTTAKIFLNKEYYKLGDALSFSILLRDSGDKAIAKKPLKISLQTPYGQSIDKKLITTSDLGAISGYFQLPDTNIVATSSDAKIKAPWRINVYLSENDVSILSFSEFHLGKADYLASKLTIDSSNAVINPKKKTSFKISAFIDDKIPTENIPVTLERSITWLKSPSKKYQGYSFGLKADMDLNGTETLQIIKLDKQGQAKLVLPKIRNKIHSALSVAIQAEIQIDNMLIAQQSKTLAYWPASDMVGVRVSVNSSSPDFNTQVDIININQADELLAAENLQIKLIKLNSANEWIYSQETWTWRQEESNKDAVVEEKSLSLIAADIGKLQLSLQQGAYRIEIENPNSGLLTQHQFTVGSVKQVSHLTNPNQLSLSLNKENYSKKETLTLTIDSVTSGEAIVQLNSPSATLWHKKISLQEGETQIDIPLNSAAFSQENLQITALGFHKKKRQYFTSKGKIAVPTTQKKAVLSLSIVAKDQAIIVHSGDYQNTAAIISIKQKRQVRESLLPKITALTQSLSFDKNGDARINNSDAKVSRTKNYTADLFFVDKTAADLNTTFTR